MKSLEKVLYVDDDDDVRLIVTMSLQQIGGLDVHFFSSGKEAVEAAAAVAPDLLLLDLMMPEMDGEETARRIREIDTLRDVPYVFITAKAQSDVKDDLVSRGALDVITKPFDPMELPQALLQAWSKSG